MESVIGWDWVWLIYLKKENEKRLKKISPYAWNMLRFEGTTFDTVTIIRKSPARLFPCQSVIHHLIVCAWQNMYQWINSGMLTFKVSICSYLQFPHIDQTLKLQWQEPPGLYRSRFFTLPFYFFIYSLIFNLQGEEDKMVAGGDENKSHPSLFIRHEKDTQ